MHPEPTQTNEIGERLNPAVREGYDDMPEAFRSVTRV
jgi:hypothetical protein